MGQPLKYPGIVNIVTLVVFFVYLVISLYLILRQGLGRSWPWIWLTTLCVCRLVQVSMDLATTQLTPSADVSNTPVSSGVAILTSMGLTPLFMSTSSLLNTTTKPKGRRMQWILLFVHVPLIISFILIVAGGIDPDSREGRPTYAATEATKAGISLYIVCFLVLVWATAVISARLYLADSQEVKILTTVVLSLPFFVVDIVYMTCFAFESWVDKTSEMRFNVISGDVTTQLCMQVIMEYIVVGLYLFLGLELPSKAARLREQIEEVKEMSADQIQETILWKLHEAISRVVAAMIMPALKFSHWMLGKILRSGQAT
ncbi:hypothetical protein OPT61_g43 [Boeremia exigua]|uniref:Uncharacterized protein n=1 Tax=Boeremia exigua TaxID=749465 RepID=A0ACC2IV95_9PLEO|nr:hypothetical protein OPT61_g43 [Boeremia exigua]